MDNLNDKSNMELDLMNNELMVIYSKNYIAKS